METVTDKENQIISFIDFVDRVFGDDFYIEVAPGASIEQIIANNKLVQIAQLYGKKVVIGDDAHYLKKEDRYIHKAYLNSKGGERETDTFFFFLYLQDENDLRKNLDPSVGFLVDEFCKNSMEMFEKIQIYDLLHNQTIPSVPVKDYPRDNTLDENSGLLFCHYDTTVKNGDRSTNIWINYPNIYFLLNSYDIYDRYWINECLNSLKEKGLYKLQYLKELEEEARVKREILY